MADYTVYPEKEPSRAARTLADQVARDGGHVLAVYQEPVGEHWQLFCLLPRPKLAASPYQRDVSPTHVKRLTEAVKRIDRFVDPILAVSPEPGVYWTPNGNHRRTALDKLKADYVPAILVAEPCPLMRVLTDLLLQVQSLHRVELDLHEVRFMNSAGMAVLIQALRMTAPRAIELVLVGPTPAVVRPLQLSGLWHRFTAVDPPSEGAPRG
jgi:anti-anti-sigma factor